ncbi:MAG: hypothetical protein OEZ06_26660 [Myxococcales bacterium]|nr:hypothetical protein [Myxococcales bacterium]
MHDGHCALAPPDLGDDLGDDLPDLDDGDLADAGSGNGHAVAAAAWEAAPQTKYAIEHKRLMWLCKVAAGREDDADGAPELDFDQVEKLAAYGESPNSPLLAAPYAVRVFSRKRTLREQDEKQSAALAECIATARRAVADIGARCVHELSGEAASDLSGEIARVRAAEETSADRADVQELAEETDAAEYEAAGDAVAAAEEAAAPFAEKHEKAERRAAKRNRDRDRAMAALKRVEIEIRALASATEPNAGRQAELEDQRQQRETELAEAEAKARSAGDALAKAQAALDEKLAHLRQLQAKKEQLLEDQLERRRQYEAEMATAEGEHETALLDLALQALKRRIATKQSVEKQRESLQALEQALRQQAHTRAAIDAYDHDAARTGMMTLGGAAGLLVLILLWLIV